MTDDQERPRDGDPLRDGVRSIAGVLGALKEAIEDTFEDLRRSGELSPDRARDAARTTFRKAQETVETVRGRLDFVTRREYDALKAEVDALHARLDALNAELVPTASPATPPPPSASDAPPPPPPPSQPDAGQPGPGQKFRFEVE
jgi:polyhydroxyalkanoate synthesis regulator phasin